MRTGKKKGITLIELSTVDLNAGREHLEDLLGQKLKEEGISFLKLSQKELEEKVQRYQIDHLTELFVQFIQKAQKRMWSAKDVKEILAAVSGTEEKTRFFLTLACQVYQVYEENLRKDDHTDYDRLIMRAAQFIEDTQGNCSI